MADRRSAWFLRARTELHDKTCHFCRQCNGHCSGPAVCGERAPTAGPDCKCHRTRKQRIPNILCTSAKLKSRYVRVDFSYYQYYPLSAQSSPPYKPSGQSFCHTVAVHNSRVVPLWQFIAGSAARFSDRTISPPGRGATGGDRRDSQDSQ